MPTSPMGGVNSYNGEPPTSMQKSGVVMALLIQMVSFAHNRCP